MKAKSNESNLKLLLPGLALSMALSQSAFAASAAPAANEGIQSNHPILSELLQEAPLATDRGLQLANYDKCFDKVKAGPFEFGRERGCPKRSAGPSPTDTQELAQLESDLQAYLS